MVESQRMGSDKLGGKTRIYAYPMLQCTIRKSWEIFVATLSVKLDGVQARKWNSDNVIAFQLVIIQRAQAVINMKHICMHIQFLLDFCNRGVFENF